MTAKSQNINYIRDLDAAVSDSPLSSQFSCWMWTKKRRKRLHWKTLKRWWSGWGNYHWNRIWSTGKTMVPAEAIEGGHDEKNPHQSIHSELRFSGTFHKQMVNTWFDCLSTYLRILRHSTTDPTILTRSSFYGIVLGLMYLQSRANRMRWTSARATYPSSCAGTDRFYNSRTIDGGPFIWHSWDAPPPTIAMQ